MLRAATMTGKQHLRTDSQFTCGVLPITLASIVITYAWTAFVATLS
jgi:hypothetical protein